MKRVEVYRSDNGRLEDDLGRAKAHDLEWELPKSDVNPNAKVLDWFQCLRIMENADIVMKHLQEYIAKRDTAKTQAEAPAATE